MSLTIRENVLPFVEEEAQQLIRQSPRQAEIIRLAVEDFRILYADKVFENIPEFLNFCTEVDQMPSVRDLPPDLVEPVLNCRRRIVATVVREYVRRRRLVTREIDPDREMRRRTRRSNLDRRERSAEELRAALEDYISLAAQIGEHEVLQVLISAGLLSEDEVPRAVRILRTYLGRSSRGPSGGSDDDIDILGQDSEVLERQSVRRVMQRMMRKRIYDVLIAQGGDTIEHHERLRRTAGLEADGVMREMARRANVPFSRHQDLFNERKTFFEQAANLPLLPCFVRTVQHQGRLHPLGSWRQRVNVAEAMRQRHVYPAPEPGGGKTFIPLWLFELLNEQRQMNGQPRGKMLYVSPKMVLDDLPNRVRPGSVQGPPNHCYYVPGREPTVGVLHGGATSEQIDQVLSNEVVFWPYSMLHARRAEERIYERIINYRDPQTGESFNLVVFDESQLLKGNGEWNRIAWDIVHRTPALYDQGNVMFMSGTPATNHLGDLRNVAEILEPRAEDQERTRGNRNRNEQHSLHPAVMRNMLERVIILDDPEEWERFVTVCDYELYDEEYQFLRMIINDETMHVKQKIDACMLAIRCPQLMSGNPNMQSGLFDYMTIQLHDDLTQKNAVLVGEFMRSQAVLRKRDGQPDENGNAFEEDEEGLYFYARLQEYCERWAREHGTLVHLHLIHGKTSERDRQTAFAQAAESDSTGTSKTVIFAHSSCLDLGKDLRFIRRMISLEWPYNSPQAQQLLKRSLRAGNTDIHMTVFYARQTIEEGIFHYAQDKYRDVRACLYGYGGISDAEIQHLSEQDDSEGAPNMRILSQVHSPEQREERIQRWLQNRGMRGYRNFWVRHRDAFRRRLETTDTLGIGDRARYTASLIAALEEAGIISGNNYLHAHSKGLSVNRMLQRIAPSGQRSMLNMDSLEYMLDEGRAAYRREGHQTEPRVVTGSIAEIGKLVADRVICRESVDAVILDELEYARSVLPPEGEAQMSQRARSIRGALRALREGGSLIINIPRDACTQEEFERFRNQTLPAFGCTVVNQWTGEARSTDNEGDPPFRMFTVVARKTGKRTKAQVISNLSNDSLQFTHSSRWGETREAARLRNEKRRKKLPSLIHTKFALGRKNFDCNINSPERAQQIVHLRALEDAAQVVRSYAASPRDFNNLSPEDRAEIAEWGIQYLPQLSTTVRRPVFRLAAFPDLFFPFDKQWSTE